jgi:WD40 repeat protein
MLVVTDVSNGNSVFTMSLMDATSAMYSPDGAQIAISTGDTGIPYSTGVIQLIDPQNGQIRVLEQEVSPGVDNIGWSVDGRLIIGYYPEGRSFLIWDTITGVLTQSIYIEGGFYRYYSWGVDSSRILLSDPLGLIEWDIMQEIAVNEVAFQSIRDLEYSPDGTKIAVVAVDQTGGVVNILDSNTLNLLTTFPLVGNVSIAWLPDSSAVVTSTGILELQSLCTPAPNAPCPPTGTDAP